ncbi:uncharacterized protein LOC113770525 [Coffea eugenioides]|uniref:uncharacterized protein LOC113770525 n=1 Tax=Coffea eugenioides TaxID=49369 RepID=UPI000F606770|nr:uncharacterized protein LOC113770525 [Coffea eugenioides]
MILEMLRRGSRVLKQSNPGQTVTFRKIVFLLMLLSIALVLVFRNSSEKSSTVSGISLKKWDSFNSLVHLDPTVEFRNGTDLISQIPDSPGGVLFLAHGCNGRAANFWDKSPKCKNCVGLPEERLVVLHALARKFAVLAVSSTRRCWTLGDELLKVKDIVKWWIAKEKLEKLPLVALGASSGGHFVSLLATKLNFSSIALMIAEGMFGQMDISASYPPTLFVHMPKDEERKQRIDNYLVVLKDKGIDVAEIKCMEFPLSPSYFSDVIPGIDRSISVKLFNLFKEKGFIDKNGYMTKDGRAIRWKAALQERDITLPDKSLFHHIQEEMNLAYAKHEMTSLQSEEILDWFESHMS